MTGKCRVAAALVLVLIGCCVVAGLATDAQLYFSSDKNGQNPATSIQEGDSIWVVVIDPDENIDCDTRDKFWTDVKLMDPKTGANLDWQSMEACDDDAYGYIGRDGCTSNGHFFEETGADTSVFVSNRPFQIGRRNSWEMSLGHGHWVGFDFDGYTLTGEFWNDWLGDFYYFNDFRDVFDMEMNPVYAPFVGDPFGPYYGWFENMDTLIGLVQDPNDPSDVAISMLKIADTEATIAWDRAVYPDANEAATITVVDPDENLSCAVVETVPVFVLVNPGSWNPLQTDSATTYCMLWRMGGVVDLAGHIYDFGIWPWNIYDSGLQQIDLAGDGSNQPNADGTYYIEYPTVDDGNVTSFDTASASGVTRVMFYAQETGPDTGVFELRLNSILRDLGFDSLRVRDVLAAYYLDPNDFDDFKVATATIEEDARSTTTLTDAAGVEQSEYWIGRDAVYAKVIDANANVDPCCPEQVVVHLCTPHEEDDSEWWILDETSSNSPVFMSHEGMDLRPTWDALGLGEPDWWGGYQFVLDNWHYEVFNEDEILIRYNDVTYANGELALLGDVDAWTAFPPQIAATRVANDVSFDMISIADTQVFDGETTQMAFLDRNGQRIDAYAASDCVFIEVHDPDQDEDVFRRERIDAYWADVENAWPFAPEGLLYWDCGPEEGDADHSVNNHLGTISIFSTPCGPKVSILNPRNGRWAAVDLLETGPSTGVFVSTICIDLADVNECVPTLGVLPGDTLIAAYQDPTNHSDSSWISIKVGIGGGGTPPSQQSTTMFVNAAGDEVSSYPDSDLVYVQVIDPSHAGAALLAGALKIEGVAYDLTLHYDGPTFAASDVFMTDALDLELVAGETITATYVDPTDPTDTSSDTVNIVSSVLEIDQFYAVPNPFDTQVTFGFHGVGVATAMTVMVYDLAGKSLWEKTSTDVTEIAWDGVAECGKPLANGAYIYVITATDGTNTFTGNGKVFVHR